ncbi:MAG TPA: type II toxin-antitoxin system death-on-curing family toxin [Acidobacteriota bacterium]|nr:type II toxin-antitoxin system death-on-curing family toxin [Acidobacteriota bacterium]
MNYLYPKQVLYLHEQIIQRSGGLSGLRDVRLLESAVYRPQSTFGGKDLYPDLFTKVAVFGHSIILNHAFVDGNKRTGFEAMRLFLRMNGFDLRASQKMKFDFVLKIATKKLTEQQIADWLRKKSIRYKK